MSGEEATPVIEEKPFALSTDRRGSSTTESSSPVTPERVIHVQQGGAPPSSEMVGVPIEKESPPISPETDMSASYHEIFDAQMASMSSMSDAHGGLERIPGGDFEIEEDMAKADQRLEPLLCCDNNTASTTEYLTSKLVEDSLKWHQNESKSGGGQGDSSSKCSPLRNRPQSLTTTALKDEMRELNINPNDHPPPPLPKVDVLDPHSIEDIERHARYLAACVDLMVENLSGVLQNASGLTVNTLETYRDGVCKTCDEVDNNIKSMYQLMAKVEELNKSMAPANKLGEQIKEIKQLLDVYEALI